MLAYDRHGRLTPTGKENKARKNVRIMCSQHLLARDGGWRSPGTRPSGRRKAKYGRAAEQRRERKTRGGAIRRDKSPQATHDHASAIYLTIGKRPMIRPRHKVN